MTNIPVPYRIPVYELVDARPDVDLTVVYCAEREPNREWAATPTTVRSIVLPGRYYTARRANQYIHLNRGVFSALRRSRPHVVITTGYNPTHLLAVLWAVLNRVPHVVQTDGTLQFESVLTGVHRLVRRFVRRVSSAFIGASDGSAALFRSYGVPDRLIFRSPLAIDNARFGRAKTPKTYDMLFSGQLVPVKSPDFALEVAAEVARRLDREVVLALAGSGRLEPELRARAEELPTVDVRFLGFVQQADLPGVYDATRVFLFPSKADAWGLVANEACAAGVPVITSPHAGSAGELIRDGVEGFVLELDVDTWASAAVDLLQDDARRARLGKQARLRVDSFSYRSAADGIVAAARLAGDRRRRRNRVLIDTLGAPSKSGGMRLHAFEVLSAWSDRGGDQDELVVIGGPWVRTIPGLSRAARVVTWPNDNPFLRMIGQQLVVPLVHLVTRRRYLLATNSVLSPLLPRRGGVVVAHDWRHLAHPEEFTRAQRLYRRVWATSARRAASVVTVSEKTAEESRGLLGIERVVTVENGRDHIARWGTTTSRPSFGPESPFLLTFGHHTNKRPGLVVEALRHLYGAEPTTLVVLGATGDDRASLASRAEALGLVDRVVLPGFVSEDAYRWLVSHAEVIVVASSDEGFGLPLAEAEALGIRAVVARDSGVVDLFPSAFAADPTPEGIADAIRRALEVPRPTPFKAGTRWSDTVDRIRTIVLGTAG